jgi:hypothetical protein
MLARAQRVTVIMAPMMDALGCSTGRARHVCTIRGGRARVLSTLARSVVHTCALVVFTVSDLVRVRAMTVTVTCARMGRIHRSHDHSNKTKEQQRLHI